MIARIVGVTRKCRHGWQSIHCTKDREGSHPGPLTPDNDCYCGEAAWLPIEEADSALREAGYVRLDGVDTEALRKALSYADPRTNAQVIVVDVARKYLAAMEGETP